MVSTSGTRANLDVVMTDSNMQTNIALAPQDKVFIVDVNAIKVVNGLYGGSPIHC